MRMFDIPQPVPNIMQLLLILLQIRRLSTLEVHLDKQQPLIVHALHRLQKPPPSERLLQHQIIRRRQVVQVILRRRHLRRPGQLVPHSYPLIS
ncbi:hypothetical protein M758_12G045500, partial [Ceratodon purpureus]